MTREELEEFETQQKIRLNEFADLITENKESLEVIKESMSTAIYEAVKKANA